MSTFTPADRIAACFVAVLVALMMTGTHYLFKAPVATHVVDAGDLSEVPHLP